MEEKASILVVDDNPLITGVLKNLLALQDYHVLVSSNGQEALEVLAKKNVDVIVCDVMMPLMDGYRLHEEVRSKAELSHIPFIFLTALNQREEMMKGMEAGADEYVAKPFDPHSLLSIIRGKVVRARQIRDASNQKYDSYRKKVIHTLSHEFRTPLVAINTGAELILDQRGRFDQDKIYNLLEAIQRGGQRLERLVNDFMVLQQIEAGVAQRMVASRARDHRIVQCLEDLVSTQGDVLHREGITLRQDIRCTDERVWIYEPQIHDILLRLLQNASKFSELERTVELHCYRLADEVHVEVRDRGIGIDVERVQEAIDVFGQIDREKLEQQGGGLGLAIASRYANLNGGRLEFERREGGGSTVGLILPVWKGL